MVSRSPPRLVVRRYDEIGTRRQWLWIGAAWLGSLLLLALLAWLPTRRYTKSVVDQQQLRALQAQAQGLKQQVADLQRSAQVQDVATESLRNTIAQREAEIGGLRNDLSFYSRLAGGTVSRQGLTLQEAKLEPIAASHGWNLMLGLTQTVKRGDETTGTVSVDVEGLRGDKVVQLTWSGLGTSAQKGGLPFRMMYFQQLHGTIVLPPDFRPMRLHIRIQAVGEEPIIRTVAWQDALSGNVSTIQGVTMLNRKRKESSSTSHETSLIARGTVVRGDLRFNGALHLDGRIEGSVLGEGKDAVFTLSEDGQVNGEIHVPHAVINGHVTGNIYVSDRLELAARARVIGDLRYHTLEMAAGALVDGRLGRYAEEPLLESPPHDLVLEAPRSA